MKCQNCGAEIGNSKFCEYCGSQITADMQKEQEQLNKKGCPKCGSSNISFKRENQGEVRGKNSKRVIHRTVGVCKDCGATWYADGEAKKKKTWLWVLGWIFIFPLPLTIILVRKKDMNKILKYSIIAVAWIVYLAIGLSGGTSDTNTNNPAEPTTQSSVVSSTEKIDVSLEVTPKVNSEDGSVLFGVSTNLPEGTELMVTVKKDSYTAQDTAVILKDGTGYTSEFSDKGKALKGDYTVTVSMSLPKLQSEKVREIIGENGENITGKYVVPSEIDSANVVSGDFKFSFSGSTGNETVSSKELVSAVKKALDGEIAPDEKLYDVTFEGNNLTLNVEIIGDTSIHAKKLVAKASITQLTNPILDLDNKYFNTWETITLDFGDVGKIVLDKSMVKDEGLGKYFEYSDDILK